MVTWSIEEMSCSMLVGCPVRMVDIINVVNNNVINKYWLKTMNDDAGAVHFKFSTAIMVSRL